MKNGGNVDVKDYFKKFNWNINDSKKFRQVIDDYQLKQRDGTHNIVCGWRTFNENEIEAEAKKVSTPDA